MSLTCSVTNFGGLFLSLSSSETEQGEGRGICLSLPSLVTKLQGLCLSLSSFETKFLEQAPYIFFPTQNTWCSVCQSVTVFFSEKIPGALFVTVFFRVKTRESSLSVTFFRDKIRGPLSCLSRIQNLDWGCGGSVYRCLLQ